MIFRIRLFSLILFLLFSTSCKDRNKISLQINAKSAMNYVQKIAQIAPRYSGHPNNAKCANLIAQIATANGADVKLDKFNAPTPYGKVEFQNVIATIKGQSEKFIIIGSHFDTKKIDSIPLFQGANDGASSTGLLLELIRTINRSKIKPYYSLRFIFFDGEECFLKYSNNDGLYGSRHYATIIKEDKSSELCKGVVICDMIGDKELKITVPSGCDAGLTKELFDVAKQNGYGKYFAWSSFDIIDDHTPFKKIGLPTVNLIDFNYGKHNRYWHTKADTVDKLSEKSLKIVGDVVLDYIINFEF